MNTSKIKDKIWYWQAKGIIIDRIAELKDFLGKDDITYKARIEELMCVNERIKDEYLEDK